MSDAPQTTTTRNFFLLWWCVGLLAVAATLWIWTRIDQVEGRSRELADSILRLERSIGYVGFIHNFKNYVLRPEEEEYRAAAEADYRTAVSSIARIEEAARKAGILVTLGDLKATLDDYRAQLDRAAAAHAAGKTIPEVDRIVRVPDRIAAQDIVASHASIQAAIDDRHNALRTGLAASLGLLLAVMFGGTQVLMRLRRQFNRAEMRRQKDLLEREKVQKRKLELAVEQLTLTNRQQAEFAYAISHDLKASAVTAQMLIRDLRTDLDDRLPPDQAELIEDLDRVTDRMLALIHDVLGYARTLDTGAPMARISLDKVLDEVLSALRADIAACNARIERAPLPEIPANWHQMRRLFQNLLSNALKYHAAGEPPQIAITAFDQVEDGQVVIEVEDKGIGIAPEHHDRIFDSFTRLHTSDKVEGTGLGLSISGRIARFHGGGITLRSSPGNGSVFSVRLGAY